MGLKRAITVIGPPLAGKTELLRPYADTGVVIYVGGFANSLPIGDPLRLECEECWRTNNTFSPELLERLLLRHSERRGRSYQELMFLDGTPRKADDFEVVSKFFDLIGLIEIGVHEDVWAKRLRDSVLNARRKSRHDSSEGQLVERKKEYDLSVKSLAKKFPVYKTVDNSGSMSQGIQNFNQAYYSIMRENGIS